MVRDIVLAFTVGSSSGADAFYIAFRIPNFMRRLFAEGAFSQAFIPVLVKTCEKEGIDSARDLTDALFWRYGLLLITIVCFGVLVSPILARVFAPGFSHDPQLIALTSNLLAITFPYLGFISLVALSSAVLNSQGHFALPAATPILLNISLIGTALWLTPLINTPAYGLAMGVLIAGFLQLAIQVPALSSIKFLPRLRYSASHPGVRRVFALMIPALFGVSVSQINLLLDTVLASFLVTGSVSWLYYADRLMELPLGIIAIALSTVMLPFLTKILASGEIKAIHRTQTWALWVVMVFGLPASMALIIFGQFILTVLFQYGEMRYSDILMSSYALSAYAIGLPAFMMIKVLAPNYFAHQDTSTPVRVGIIAMTANMVLNLFLVWIFDHVGLALATALAGWLNAALLLRGLCARGWYAINQIPFLSILKILAATAVMAQIYWLLPDIGSFQEFMWLERSIWLVIILLASLASYFATLWIFGFRYSSFLIPSR